MTSVVLQLCLCFLVVKITSVNKALASHCNSKVKKSNSKLKRRLHKEPERLT